MEGPAVKEEPADHQLPADHPGRPVSADTEVAYSAAIPPRTAAGDCMVVRVPEVLPAMAERRDNRAPQVR